MDNSGGQSSASVTETFILEKIRANPEAMAKVESALEAKTNADRAAADAKKVLQSALRELTATIADEDEFVTDFATKRPRTGD